MVPASSAAPPDVDAPSSGTAALDAAPEAQRLVADEIVARLGQLATLPSVTLRITEMTSDPNASGEMLDRLLASDPTLGARVLRVVNSAFYGLSGTVTTTGAAIVRLGFAAIRNIAIAASLTRMFRGGRLGATFDARDVWRHSVAVAEGASRLARLLPRGGRVQAPADEALLAGLLHDLGLVVAMQGDRPAFEALLAALEAGPEGPFAVLEARHLHTTHARLGEALANKWSFPPSLARVCAHHHDPLVLPEAERTLAALVHVADHLAVRAGQGYTRTVQGETLDPDAVTWLGLSDANLEQVLEALPQATAEAMLVLGDGR
jgi:putative nucleotidyltransferase with HDIG domain